MTIAVVIVAGGRGSRMSGGVVPKQYMRLGDRAVVAHAVAGFQERQDVSEICVVIHKDDTEIYHASVGGLGMDVPETVPGGATRQESVLAGLKHLERRSPDCVLIHDSARPFASPALIERVVGSLGGHDGVVPALTVTDTLKQVDGDGRIVSTLDRSTIRRAQTPQGFSFPAILDAHEAAQAEKRTDFTDDASLAEWRGLDVAVVEGDAANLKITTDQDLEDAEQWLRRRAGGFAGECRVGQGFDVHAFGGGHVLVLGGLEVPHDKGLSGHSDADVVLHALTDALLGAIADGDIGAHFPPTESKWKGASSDIFLKDALARIAARGGSVVNVDLTVICEMPKIGPHRDAMRESIARIIDVDVSRVSVKATTTEGLGFTGRGEGIAAQAVAMVRF